MSRRRLACLAVPSVLALAGVAPACLEREVAVIDPTTKTSFDTTVPQPAIEKVDLLLMVDNSQSMADKQRILAAAVPDLVQSLVRPKCVEKVSRAASGALADPARPRGEQCPAGTEPAFAPITDVHVGIISSSLGGMGSSSCRGGLANENDEGQLLARRADGTRLPQAGELGFLAFYPDVEQNRDKRRHPDPPVPALTTTAALEDAFRELVVGVGQQGCGLEAQLESVYHFLIQPDPWTSIDVTDGRASYGPKDRIDVDLLRQRAAFLRPDSLVAVILLTDEDDSSVDPLAFEGTAWRFEDQSEATRTCPDCGPRARGTRACEFTPAARECTSCVFAPTDPNCVDRGGYYTSEEDPLNVRFHAMKRRYGVDPQFPLARYVDAFTKPKVPLRDSEHDGKGGYVGKPDCVNPLFAAHLPTNASDKLCELGRGPRSKDLVFFAVIGGVPNQLLPASGKADAIDWTKILGRDPSRWDEEGIDPHMIPSTAPRIGLPPPTAGDDADPIHGREWDTLGGDLQYACTFDLYERKADGTVAPVQRTCAPGDATCNSDCDGTSDAPLCAKGDRRVQVKGKAYPTRRELIVARDLGDQGIVASLCPQQLTNPAGDDYGYRPAVRSIASRLEQAITASCLPRALTRESENGPVACTVLATLPDPGPDSACAAFGLAPPDGVLLAQHRDRVAVDEGEASRTLPVCEVPQIPVPRGTSCRDEETAIGFCYAEALPGARCEHALSFTGGAAKLVDARFTLRCIQLNEKTDAGPR